MSEKHFLLTLDLIYQRITLFQSLHLFHLSNFDPRLQYCENQSPQLSILLDFHPQEHFLIEYCHVHHILSIKVFVGLQRLAPPIHLPSTYHILEHCFNLQGEGLVYKWHQNVTITGFLIAGSFWNHCSLPNLHDSSCCCAASGWNSGLMLQKYL